VNTRRRRGAARRGGRRGRVLGDPRFHHRLGAAGAGLGAVAAGAAGAALASARRHAEGEGGVLAAFEARAGLGAQVGDGQGEQGAGRGEPAGAYPGGDQQALAEGLAGFGVEHRLEAGEGGGGGFGRGGGIGLGGEALAVAGEHKAQAVEAGGEEHRRVVGRLAALAAPPAAAHQLVEGVGKRRDVVEAHADLAGARL
jgi:hypothetical protein